MACEAVRARHTGTRWQRPRRAIERAARRQSVAFDRWGRKRGLASHEIADALRLAPRTLRHWKHEWRRRRLTAPPRGRRPTRSSRSARNAVLQFLRLLGPAAPWEMLRAQFPQMAAAELKRLLRRYRQACRRQRAARPQRLYWFFVGSVWATDFVEQLGGLGWVLSVCDLASRQQLLWQHVESPNAEVVIAALKELFSQHGPPLVLKSDNGSGYIAAATCDLLAQHGVIPLFSPPRRPQYNGGCERGGGILKGYTYQVALNAGRPGVCLAADLEQARQLANALSRLWGHRGPSPADVWRARPRLSAQQRQAFQDELSRCRIAACQLLEYPLDQPLSRAQAARRDRRALQAVLEALGYLQRVARRDPLLRRPPAGVPALLPPPAPTAVETNSNALPAPLEEKPCTLNCGPAAGVGSDPEVPRRLPAHVESAINRVPRRSNTPLFTLLKAANIP
jgi:transposase InsO family protein